MVYIFGFDNLYNYTGEIENRNAAFTSISRAKGWLRISGVGSQMETAEAEISSIVKDLPCFKFKFPDLEQIRRLDAETSRRRKEKRKARDSVAKLINTDRGAVEELLRERPELREHLQQLLREISDAN